MPDVTVAIIKMRPVRKIIHVRHFTDVHGIDNVYWRETCKSSVVLNIDNAFDKSIISGTKVRLKKIQAATSGPSVCSRVAEVEIL